MADKSTDLIKITGSVARISFDRIRKLKPQHRYIRAAVQESGKPVNELIRDMFGGLPYLLQALLTPALGNDETLSLDQTSDLIDQYLDQGGTLLELQRALLKILADYMHIELKPVETEDVAEDVAPNA